MKYGSVKAKFIFYTIIILFPGGPAVFAYLLADIDFSVLVNRIAAIPDIIICSLLLATSVILFIISMVTSLRIFERMEL